MARQVASVAFDQHIMELYRLQIMRGAFSKPEANDIIAVLGHNESNRINWKPSLGTLMNPVVEQGRLMEPELPVQLTMPDFKQLLNDGYNSWQQSALASIKAT